MKNLILAAVIVLLSTAPALACLGVTEFPETEKLLDGLNLSAEDRAELMKDFRKGERIHTEGHETNDMNKMGQSMMILEGVKKQIGK